MTCKISTKLHLIKKTTLTREARFEPSPDWSCRFNFLTIKFNIIGLVTSFHLKLEAMWLKTLFLVLEVLLKFLSMWTTKFI